MTKTEARQLMMKYLMPRIEQYGFKERGKGTEFEIVKKTKNGEDIISGGFTDYNPRQQIVYGIGKVNSKVAEILVTLQNQGIQLSPPANKKARLISFSYRLLNNLTDHNHMPIMETEKDVENCVAMMADFIEDTAIPLLDKFEDLREIDRMVNGDEPWETDAQRPYRFGTYFNFNRLIIAKLSGNVNYNTLIDFTYSTLEKSAIENGHNYVYDRNDLTKPLPALIKLLETVEPLY